MPNPVSAALIYPHQLFTSLPAHSDAKHFVWVEEPLLFQQFAFHRQKLLLHRASMQWHFQHAKIPANASKHFLDSSSLSSTHPIVPFLQKLGITHVSLYDPEDNYLERRLKVGLQAAGIEMTMLPSPNFLTPVDKIESWGETLQKNSKLFFTQFYIEQRKRLGILVDRDGKPIGGKWSFDTENRKKLPKGLRPPTVQLPRRSAMCDEASAYVDAHFKNAIGDERPLLYPHHHDSAAKWLEQFLDERLSEFGDYEDAIDSRETFLFHSILTPMLNIGLLSPQQIVDRALERIDRVPLNSLEGFLRQVIGWREYIRLVYRTLGVTQRNSNHWNHQQEMPKAFYDASTGIEPVDRAIERVLAHGYCHHIERLMILGNFMMLCEIHPHAVYRWFMEMFVDAYDWVMVPNVYGMSQFADGGRITTKPYLSGSAYVLRMSNFSKGPWCAIWDGLYWRFIAKHRAFFASNPRMSVMTSQLDRMGSKLQDHQATAERFLEKLHS